MMAFDFWFIIGLLFGLMIGLAINAQARQERDDEIERLKKQLEQWQEKEITK